VRSRLEPARAGSPALRVNHSEGSNGRLIHIRRLSGAQHLIKDKRNTRSLRQQLGVPKRHAIKMSY